MIRIDLEDDSFGPWYVWLLFNVQEHGSALSLESVLIPDYEMEPDTALATPQGREQVPISFSRELRLSHVGRR